MSLEAWNPSSSQSESGFNYNGISEDPSSATNYYPTADAASAAWDAANPQYASDFRAPGGASPGASGQPDPASGLPSSSQVSATAPAPLQAFGALPQISPSYASAATVDPNAQYGYLQQQEQANAQSLQPTFQNQDQTEQDQLAARGISSSGSAQELTDQLHQGQGATLAGMNAPAIAQQAGYTQGDIAQNQANEQQVNLGNTTIGNTAAGINANYYDQALTGNASAYNNYLMQLEQQGAGLGNASYSAYLNSYGPNTGVQALQNTGQSGTLGTYGNVYGQTIGAQGAALGALGGAAGSAASGGFSGGGRTAPGFGFDAGASGFAPGANPWAA